MRYLILLLCFLIISCMATQYSIYPYQTKVKYENESNTTDKTDSDKDTIKSGETWSIEQVFKWRIPK